MGTPMAMALRMLVRDHSGPDLTEKLWEAYS